jgi:hypothetical protein
MSPLPYAGTLLRGCTVRIVGLLVAALAGTAFASEGPHESGLARFAYVNTLVFQTSFGELVPKRPLEPAPPKAADSRGNDFRPVLLVAAETIARDPIEIAESAKAIAMDGVETVTLVGDVERAPAAQDTAKQLASLEPTSLLTESAPPVPETVPQFAALESPSRLSESMPAAVQETTQQITALEPSSLLSDSVPVAREAPRQLAALEPSSLISDSAPDEVLTAGSNRPVHAPPILKHTHKRSAHASAPKHMHAAKKKVASATVPKWATKMFEGAWQLHAFAYQ